jgi:cytochrome c-type biogenesis protein CcmH
VNETLRRISLLVAVCSLACGGPSAPRPAASAASPAASDDLRPLSSREAPATGAAATSAPVDPAASLPPGHPPIGPAAPAAPAGDRAQARLSGTILLSPKLAAGPSDVLYVMAKQGPTTLVVRRIEKPAFPVTFELSDSDSMGSGVAFEGTVDVVARLSRSGDAIPAKGDLEGTTRGVALPATGVRVTIDTVRP